MRYLAISLVLLASCGDDDGVTPDAPDDLVVDSDEIVLDGDDVDSADIDGSGDVGDLVMIDADGDVSLPDAAIDAAQGTVFLSETDVDFGIREVGAPTVGRTLVLTNSSAFTVFVVSLDVTGTSFALGGTTCGSELAAGASCDLVVSAAPSALGDQEGQLVVLTDVNTPFATLRAIGGRRITVTRTGAGTGTISSSPPGIACGSTCSGVFPGNVSLVAGAGGDSTFETWTGPCSGAGTCVIPAGTSAVTVGAQFALSGDASIRVAFGGSAAGAVAILRNGTWLATCTSSCERTVEPGDVLELKATSPVGFSGFSAGCTASGPQSCTVTAAAGANTVSATFAPPAGVAWTRLIASTGHAVWDSSGDLVIATSSGLVKLNGTTGVQLSTIPRIAQFLEAGPSSTLVIIGEGAVVKLSASGAVMWERPLPSALGSPNSLAVGADGTVAVHGSSAISRWAADGTPSWTVPRGYPSPGGVAIGSMGIVLVPREDAGTVHGRRYAAADGAELPELIQIGTGRVAGGIGIAISGQIGTSFSSNGGVFTQLGSVERSIVMIGSGPVTNTASFSANGHAAVTAHNDASNGTWYARHYDSTGSTLVMRSGQLLAPGVGVDVADAAAGVGARFALVGTYTDFAVDSDSDGATVGWVQAYSPSP